MRLNVAPLRPTVLVRSGLGDDSVGFSSKADEALACGYGSKTLSTLKAFEIENMSANDMEIQRLALLGLQFIACACI
jgi:hypothetical protein